MQSSTGVATEPLSGQLREPSRFHRHFASLSLSLFLSFRAPYASPFSIVVFFLVWSLCLHRLGYKQKQSSSQGKKCHSIFFLLGSFDVILLVILSLSLSRQRQPSHRDTLRKDDTLLDPQ